MALVDAKYEIVGDKIYQSVSAGEASKTGEVEVSKFFTELAQYTPYNTGWMPPGVRLITQNATRMQVVVECPPGINLTWWGEYENDKAAKLFELAQPYRVIIMDFLNGNFYGARMFYSPIPVNGPETPLYNVNLPNTNMRGYGKCNGVGWVCLYHGINMSAREPLGKRINQIIDRCSGFEAYNNANMSETDGTRFYQSHNYPSYTWNPKLWEKKSEKEGYEWTLNANVWMPTIVPSKDNQRYCTSEGVHLTVGMAVEGRYGAYYSDTDVNPSDAQRMRSGGVTADDVHNILNRTFAGKTSKSFGKFGVEQLSVEPPKDNTPQASACDRCEEPSSQLFELGPLSVCKLCNSKDRHCQSCNSVKRSYVFVTQTKCKLCSSKEEEKLEAVPENVATS